MAFSDECSAAGLRATGGGPTAPLGLGFSGWLCGIAGCALCAALIALAAVRRAVDWGPCADCDGDTTGG
eukprot:6850739-Prymnesium_polylepis.1